MFVLSCREERIDRPSEWQAPLTKDFSFDNPIRSRKRGKCLSQTCFALCDSSRLTLHIFYIYDGRRTMSEYEHESRNRLLLANGFNVMQDDGSEIQLHGSRATIYGEAGVNVYVQDAAGDGKGGKGTLVVDRGVVLLQRSKYGSNGGMLSISAFGREKMDDSMPDVVIPVGSIYKKIRSKKFRSKSGSLVKGELTIETAHSLDTKMAMGPMVITVRMSVVGMATFMSLFDKATETWPHQESVRTY